MPTKYPEEFIIQTVKKYESGTSIKELSKTQNVASSTLYHWVKAYKTIPRKKGEYTPVGYQRLLDHKRKLDRQLEVIHLSGCIDLIPAHQRLFVLEDIHENHPEYSIYELCEALEVPRGTFYNHIKRRLTAVRRKPRMSKSSLESGLSSIKANRPTAQRRFALHFSRKISTSVASGYPHL